MDLRIDDSAAAGAGRRIVVLGAGPAGYVAALHASALGAQVTLVEPEGLGGTCLQRGCIPTKTLVAACTLLEKMKESARFGIFVQGEIVPRWQAMREQMGQVVATIEKGVAGLLQNRSVTLIRGRGRLAPGPCVEVDGYGSVPADHILICTGSSPSRPPAFPCDGERICTSDEVLRWEGLPRSLLIVGEGVIACEFAFIFNALGVEVGMVGMMDRPLPTLDADVSATIGRELRKRRMRFVGNSVIDGMQITGEGVVALQAGQAVARGERVLVCVGRVPNTAGLGFEEAGGRLGTRGEIPVDAYQQTALAGVYAAGDVTGGPMLAHVASAQGRLAIDHMLGRSSTPIDYASVPLAVFTRPEIGCVGLSEAAAKSQGREVRCGTFDLRGLGKAQAMGELAGMAKVVADAQSGELLGLHIVGPHASDIVHEAAVLLRQRAGVEALAETIHAHPTLSEAVVEAAEGVFGQALHKPLGVRRDLPRAVSG